MNLAHKVHPSPKMRIDTHKHKHQDMEHRKKHHKIKGGKNQTLAKCANSTGMKTANLELSADKKIQKTVESLSSTVSKDITWQDATENVADSIPTHTRPLSGPKSVQGKTADSSSSKDHSIPSKKISRGLG